MALPMGTLLNGRYMTGKVLGIGGFGITYLGYDLTLEIKIAIKEYMPSGLATRHSDQYRVALIGRKQENFENGMERFLEEARILAKLQNTPNIVSVQNYFKENGTAYFVMEYIDGMSLKAYLVSQGGKIPFEQALTILLPVMQALAQVHALNLTHRDISPDNIFITSGGESKLLDFGAARFSVGDEKSVSVILKHGYAPEEQYSSRGNQGPWTDVYAMGATMYRCITGELPLDSIMRVHNDTLKKPSELGVAIPPYLENAMMKALAVKAEDRFSGMEAFVSAVTGKLGGHSSRAGAAGGAGTKQSLWSRFRQFSLGMQIASLLICVAVVGFGVWGIVRGVGTLTGGIAMEKVSLSEYTNDYLNISMGIPEGLKEMEVGSASFSSDDGGITLQVGFFASKGGFVVYDLSDVEKNAENYVSYYLGLLESTDITGQEILSRGYHQIGSLNSYQIQFSATESGGSTMEFVAAFIECQNGFGCYNIIASYPHGDKDAQKELLAAINSFASSGPAGTAYKMYSDEKFPLEFLYQEDSYGVEFEIKSEDRLSMSAQSESLFEKAEVHWVSGNLAITRDEWLDILEQSFLESFSEEQLERTCPRRHAEYNGVEWAIDEYEANTDGITYYISAYCGEVDGYLIMTFAMTDDETEKNIGMAWNVMRTVRVKTTDKR